MLSFQTFVTTAAAVGAVLYGFAAWRKKGGLEPSDLAGLFMAAFACALFPSGLHLTYCSYCPDCLVHVKHADGTALEEGKFTYEIGEVHGTEIAASGIAVVVVSVFLFSESLRQLRNPQTPTTPPAPLSAGQQRRRRRR